MSVARFVPIYRLSRTATSHKGYSLVEVVVSLAILLAGIVSIMAVFPWSLRAHQQAADVSAATLLAQKKAEEIRRDNDRNSDLMIQMRLLRTPTAPLAFNEDERLTYSFCGVSLIDPIDDPGDPRDDIGVARVIVRYNPKFRSSQQILYELRFDE
ncbi:MAG: hypothetical protein V2A74_03150 [bacterium]